MSMSEYSREKALQARINEILTEQFDLPAIDYYSKLDITGFLKFKLALSDINNILTLKLTSVFAEMLGAALHFDAKQMSAIRSQIDLTKPNANGFDIELSSPFSVVVEVKCVIPINQGEVYGSAQRKGIEKDLDALSKGKSKSPIDVTKALRFMVFLDIPKVRAATRHFLASSVVDSSLIEIVKSTTNFVVGKIYIWFIKI